MKNLILVRHAKTEVFAPSGKVDFYRELADIGYSQIEEMCEKLEKILPEGDLIISSPANRALQTARLFTSTFFPWESITEVDDIYSTTAEKIIEIISKIASSTDKTIWLFGHNPTITQVSMNLCADFNLDMTTCSIVWLRFNTTDWKTINQNNLLDFKYFKPSQR